VAKFHDQISIFVLHNVFEEGTTEYLLLKALRCYIEVDIYASLEVHTETTIASGREKLTCFFELMDVSPSLLHYIPLGLRHNVPLVQAYFRAEKTGDLDEKNWNFPKIHLQQHLFDDIVAKGATRNYSSKPNEGLNRPLKNKYTRTNFRDVAEQVNQADV